jgi:hypothetical protein
MREILVHNRIFANTALSPKAHRFTPRFQQKRYVALHVIAGNA